MLVILTLCTTPSIFRAEPLNSTTTLHTYAIQIPLLVTSELKGKTAHRHTLILFIVLPTLQVQY